MPITPFNGDESSGVNVIADVYANKDQAAVIYTRFSNIFAAIHINTSGVIVAGASAAGTTGITLDVAATGTLIVFGTRGANGAPATVTLS